MSAWGSGHLAVQYHRVLASAFVTVCLISSATALCCAEADSQIAEWTVLIYLDGDNNLDEYSEMDIEEMMGVGSTDKVRVLVLWDRYDQPVYLYEVRSTGLEVISGLSAKPPHAEDPIELNGQEVNMGDWRILEAFVDFGIEKYPSEHLMVILWDHGSPLFGVCWDDHYDWPWWPIPFSISYDDVGTSLSGHHVDVLAFDSCSAGMAEVAYKFGQMNACGDLSVDYMLASELYVPVFGYPYDRMLLQMNSLPETTDVPDVAAVIAAEYADSYSAESPENGGNTANLAVISPSGMVESVDAVSDLAALLQSRLESDYATYKPLISDARGEANLIWGVPSDYGFIDLPMFLQGLSKMPRDREVRSCAENALTSLQSEAVLYVGNADAAESGSAMGLGVWLPPTIIHYEWVAFQLWYDFDFGEDTGWLDFAYALTDFEPPWDP
ncbi:MAG: clostripain-related cysteine peptidase [Thermoplasmata archaeon]|nr:clostripain-related cysteine peptidase [Thermoplasmata archaeon]